VSPEPALPAEDGEARGGDVSERLEQAHGWVVDHWPTTLRRRIGAVAVVIALGLAAISWLARLVGVAVDLGLLAYGGLMVVCWVGAGGALVPIPGVRPLSWVMIVHQGTVLSPPVVALAAAVAMALGQSSYFVATRTGARRHAEASGHHRLRHEDLQGNGAAGASGGSGKEASGGTGKRAPNRLVARSRALLSRARDAVERRMKTHPQRIIFLLCVVPNPLTTFATVTAASSGVPFRSFVAASLAGFLVLTIALVLAGQSILAALGLS